SPPLGNELVARDNSGVGAVHPDRPRAIEVNRPTKIRLQSKHAGQGRDFSLESRLSFAAQMIFRASARQRKSLLRIRKSRIKRSQPLPSSSQINSNPQSFRD